MTEDSIGFVRTDIGAGKGEIVVAPDSDSLLYSGRIGRSETGKPVFVFPCTNVRFRFRGTGAAIVVTAERYYYDIYAGFTVDIDKAEAQAGKKNITAENATPYCVCLPDRKKVRIQLCEGLEETEHEIMFFKRQDACNRITIENIVLAEGSELLNCAGTEKMKIEVYGDSVSAGEVSEALDCVGKPDPEGHEGRYSNAWYSYSWLLARKLNAGLHDIAQGGLALLPKTGWFSGPDYVGLEQIYDKVIYYPDLANASAWDFSKYTPDVCIVAIGQNDANPDNYMKDDYNGEKAKKWREHYKGFLMRLKELYTKAIIICTTTILMHDEAWDRAIDEVVCSFDADAGIRHFLYSKNGAGTPGHIRIPEAEVMAEELSAYIREIM